MICSVTVSAPVVPARPGVVVRQTTLTERFVVGLAGRGSSGLAGQQA